MQFKFWEKLTKWDIKQCLYLADIRLKPTFVWNYSGFHVFLIKLYILTRKLEVWQRKRWTRLI